MTTQALTEPPELLPISPASWPSHLWFVHHQYQLGGAGILAHSLQYSSMVLSAGQGSLALQETHCSSRGGRQQEGRQTAAGSLGQSSFTWPPGRAGASISAPEQSTKHPAQDTQGAISVVLGPQARFAVFRGMTQMHCTSPGSDHKPRFRVKWPQPGALRGKFRSQPSDLCSPRSQSSNRTDSENTSLA
jgi:hypothetical protein